MDYYIITGEPKNSKETINLGVCTTFEKLKQGIKYFECKGYSDVTYQVIKNTNWSEIQEYSTLLVDLDVDFLQSKENRFMLINKISRIINFTHYNEEKIFEERFSYKLQELFDSNRDIGKNYNLIIEITNPDPNFFLKMNKKEKLEYACGIISKNTDLTFSEKGV